MTHEVFDARGGDGLVRRGILTIPDGAPPRAALLLITAGVKYRTGPSQLYIAVARSLAAAGFATLRIDAIGVGESDGLLEAGPSHLIFQTAERGRFVPDVEVAFQALASRLAPQVRIFVGGLCGGGLTAQLAASKIKDRRLAGVLSFNIAVRHTPTPGRRPAPVTSEAKATLAAYPRKLLKAQTWKRIVSGSVRIGHVKRTLAAAAGKSHTAEDSGVNPLFIPSFTSLLKRKVPQLLIFSGNDDRWAPFSDLILGPVLKGAREGPAHTVKFIADADHHLCLPEWRDEALGWIADWMRDVPNGRSGA
jgi:pimeloyl-ACP methyl ester carboxylesterase